MLRRPATTIRLTPEDILEYDDALAQQKYQQQLELQQQQQQQQQQHFHNDHGLQEQINNSSNDLNASFKATAPSRDARIGVNRKPSTN